MVAEGVETKQQLDFLISEACDLYQSYYFSRPLQAEKVPALLDGGLSRLKLGHVVHPRGFSACILLLALNERSVT